ncbi:MAG: pyruvate, phosphate dikinase [Nitrospirae bacterium]|nr:pyruvate, phosphate dikinase [Nitrospirota bacterium]
MAKKAASSWALRSNISDYSVDVTIDPKYQVVLDVMERYHGLKDGLITYLKELCHPYKNWQFIVKETWTYSLGYFYELKTHPKGAETAALFLDAAAVAIASAKDVSVKADGFSLFYLLSQKILKESAEDLPRFIPILEHAFEVLDGFDDELFSVIAKSHYQLNRLIRIYTESLPEGASLKAASSLIIHYLKYTYSYWLKEQDPLTWAEKEIDSDSAVGLYPVIKPVSHACLKELEGELNATAHILALKTVDPMEAPEALDTLQVLDRLLSLPGYGSIVGIYGSIPQKIFDSDIDEKHKYHYKLIFLFYVMNLAGLSAIHEETLREINRIIKWLIKNESFSYVKELIHKTFEMLINIVELFPNTVLKCVLNMGKGVYETGNEDLVNFFNYSVDPLGFQSPDFLGISDEWQILSNSAHIENIRTWMELIKLNPRWSKKLLSSLIIQLCLSGVLIKDTDLFPRDITSFLNGEMQPVYNLVKQLMRLFPAYFNELGAEGHLRDVSTRLDEACNRKDALIHFLRKQSHVESSNKIISLVEASLDYWKTGSKDHLRYYLPPGLFEECQNEGPYIDGVHAVMGHIFESKKQGRVSDLLKLDDDYLVTVAGEIDKKHSIDLERVALMISFYKLLHQKYSSGYGDLDAYIAQVQTSVFPPVVELRSAINEEDVFKKLSGVLKYLERLKSLIISPNAYEVREDIYRKRHISTDIPSMYGSYHEAKFDAMGLTFRLEALANTCFEELIQSVNLDFITRATFKEIFEYLQLFNRALVIDGIPTREFDRQMEFLDRALAIRSFTFTQYLDIFRGFAQVVNNIVNDHFVNIHKTNLNEILVHLPVGKLLPKYRSFDDEDLSDNPAKNRELFHKVSEIFIRDGIATSLGIQSLDLFLTRILNTLHKAVEKTPADKHHLFVTYNPSNAVVSLGQPYEKVFDHIHLGNKGYNLVRMCGLGLPVPQGFIITTEVFRSRELLDIYMPANKDFKNKVDKEIATLEKLTGKRFGDPENPLLISVRSGAAVSQPGMLDSYLNVGMNEDIVEGIIRQTGKAWFAWDCYRRFLQSYGMSFGIERDLFDALIADFKQKYGAALKKDLTPGQMKEVAIAYKELIASKDVEVAESPKEQLHIAIRHVLNSWNSAKASTYRKIIGISDDWGTAVSVQAMVYGNINDNSGSGVLFTHNPKISEYVLRPWGDYSTGIQGEDVVSGLIKTSPISNHQAFLEGRNQEITLETRFPEIFQTLLDISKTLVEEKQWSPQDIEFTFEGPKRENLYILQSRDMELRERLRVPSFEITPDVSKRLLGHGIGVSGGARSGRVVFTLEEISAWRRAEPETPLILVRADTVPDDISEIYAADGLFTARGGATSHASIVAGRLGKTCVVGCADLECNEKQKIFVLNQKTIKSGDFISIDGSEGAIYLGIVKISERDRV